MFQGICTAISTPFSNGKIDYKSLENLINFQLTNDIDAICPCGTTGEIATLSDEEYTQVVSSVVKNVNGKAFVLAGVGGNNTAKVIENCKKAEDLGVNGILAVAPYYNKPSQDGLYAHFEAVARSTKLPIMLYNVPARTVTDISDETIVKLAKIDNIVALKDATGLLERTALLRAKLINAGISLEKFKIYSGDDVTALGFIAMGAVGLISVASNIIPKECADMVKLALSGDFAKARQLQDKYAILFDSMFIDTNPAPVKYCLAKMGIMKNELRLPLVEISAEKSKILDEILKDVKIYAK